MVLVNEYSRLPIVKNIRLVSVHAIIPVLCRHLALFGHPPLIKSDIGALTTCRKKVTVGPYLRFGYTVEPLLYDHRQNHIGVVV